MNRINTFLAAAIAVASIAAPVAAFEANIIDGVRIDTILSDLTNLTLPIAVRGRDCTFDELVSARGVSSRKTVGWLNSSHPRQDIYAQYIKYTGEWWNDRFYPFTYKSTTQDECMVVPYE